MEMHKHGCWAHSKFVFGTVWNFFPDILNMRLFESMDTDSQLYNNLISSKRDTMRGLSIYLGCLVKSRSLILLL